ncbi:Lead, cadmium, zinc and mercury transporting ATPase; Copper-translocating P-type ATPase [hydrothermal vent metagenome]|uniref:Lead, cadmium, zinc and mercury transporting ATPase Copper-translocating P-type ATPase n=1 Tax=hydrothermal vent metagenome TaxID=652676 RepID=A0A3B0QUM8_9ZZZZ
MNETVLIDEGVQQVSEAGVADDCFHCGLDATGVGIRESVGGGLRDFCCNGCLQVARYIFSAGLEAYYDKRSDSRPGVVPEALAGKLVIDEDADFIRVVGDEKEASLIVKGIHCAACIWLIEHVVGKASGVTSARLNFSTHKLHLKWSPAATGLKDIIEKLGSIGYEAAPYTDGVRDELLEKRRSALLIKMIVAAFGTAATVFFADGLYAGFFWGIEDGFRDFMQWTSMAVAVPVVLFSASIFVKGALAGLRHRSLTMDLPIALGAIITLIYSSWATVVGRGDVYFDSACMFVFLILLGRYFEAAARRKAAAESSNLQALEINSATLILGGERKRVATSEVKVGDIIEVAPGEAVALDGVIVEGRSTIDESMLTGESRPLGKEKGDLVYGNTINIDGSLRIRVTKVGADTAFSTIKRMVEDAQLGKARIQRIADRIAAYFVPLILIVAAGTFVYWSFYDISNAVVYSVAVLIITCPCALALATPCAILAGCGAAARRGILIKGGEVLETACKATVVVMDKTGTLTEGKMSVDGIFVDGGLAAIPINEREVLRIAASMECRSEHPIGKAIVKKAGLRAHELYKAQDFKAIPGRGVAGKLLEVPGFFASLGHESRGKVISISGETDLTVYIGNEKMMRENGVAISSELYERRRELSASAVSSVYLAIGAGINSGKSRAVAVISVTDPVRAQSVTLIERLSAMGLDTIMLSGDNRETAEAVAGGLGIARVISEVMPEDKEEVVKKLQGEGEVVVMVGDGINDAPALAAADVGMAVGSGTGLAIDSADVVLLNSNPLLVGEAIELSRSVYGGIKQNLWISLFYNLLFTPLAAMGFVVPVVAAIVMPLSSLIVIGNSVRAARKGLGARGV